MRRKNWKKFPIAALATLAVVTAFETQFVWKYRYHFWDANYILLEKKREAITGPHAPDDVAILGSSKFYHIQPEPVAQLIGKNARVINYSWGFSGVEAYEAMLRGLIAADRVPSIILVDGFPEIFSFPSHMLTIKDSEEYRIRLAQTAPVKAGIRTAVGLKEWAVAWDLFTYSVTPPSTLSREKLRTGMDTFLKTKTLPPLPPHYENLVENWLRQGWFYFAAPEKVAGPEDFQLLTDATGPHVFRNNVSVAAAYERFIQLAYANNIYVVMLPVPSNPVLYEAFDQRGVFQRYDEWLSELETKYPNFRAPGPRWVTWPGLLGDAGHVNAAGAKMHMNLILDILAHPVILQWLNR